MRRFCVILLALVIISGIPYTADAVTIQKNITAGIENETYNEMTGKIIRFGSAGTYNLRAAAGEKLFGYDTFQGACSDGKNAYYILYNRAVEKCKIAKVRLKDFKLVKVSSALKIHHGNDLTYNDRTGEIIAIHLTGVPDTIAVINPDTLKVKRNIKIELPVFLHGLSEDVQTETSGYNAITYDSENNCYYVRVRGIKGMIMLDREFRPLELIKTSAKKSYTIYAGLNMLNGDIVSQESTSVRSLPSYLSLYDRSGKLKCRIKVNCGYELENGFFVGDTYYLGFYHSYYENKKLARGNYIYKFSDNQFYIQ